MKLPDELIEDIRPYVEYEGAAKMQLCRKLGEVWGKYGEPITYNYADENGLDEPSEEKARAWFLASLAGNLANVSYSTLANRMRVYRNVIGRGYEVENEAVSYSVWMLLLRNLPEKDGIVEPGELNKRLDWYYDEGMPTTRTIEDYVKNNGRDPEWTSYWKAIVRNAKKLEVVQQPFPELVQVTKTILFLDNGLVEKRKGEGSEG